MTRLTDMLSMRIGTNVEGVGVHSACVHTCSYQYVDVFFFVVVVFFLFQAEDGIRDLVRSRGLGDVYKRQTLWCVNIQRHTIFTRMNSCHLMAPAHVDQGLLGNQINQGLFHVPVSYTHLTLPTSDLV